MSVAIVGLVGYLLLGHQPPSAGPAWVAALPLLNACLNAASAALLTGGWLFIRRRRVTAHKTCMVSALVVSTLFLVSYVTYHSLAGSRPFGDRKSTRLNSSHTVISYAVFCLKKKTTLIAPPFDSARDHAQP